MPKSKDDGQTYYEMPKTNKTKKKVKHRKCACKITGVVALYVDKGDYFVLLDHREYERNLRKFRFCPLCGRRKGSR